MNELTSKRKAIITMRAWQAIDKMEEEERLKILMSVVMHQMSKTLSEEEIDEIGENLPDDILSMTKDTIEQHEEPELLN